jgi:hypothetical protein
MQKARIMPKEHSQLQVVTEENIITKNLNSLLLHGDNQLEHG